MNPNTTGLGDGMADDAVLNGEQLRRVHRRGSREVVALDDVTLTISPGRFVTITGPSGSGKSTLLQLLGLIDRPTSGTVRLGGTDTADLSDDERSEIRRKTFGFVFQSFLLMPGLTAWENVALPELLDGRSLQSRKARARELLDEVGLADRWDHPPHELSGGEQQRVGIARALMGDPAVVFADEPTGALDQASSVEIVAVLRRLTVDRGSSLVVVTHDPLVANHGDATTVELCDGRLVDRVVAAS